MTPAFGGQYSIQLSYGRVGAGDDTRGPKSRPTTAPDRSTKPEAERLYSAAKFGRAATDNNVSKQDTHFFNVFSMVIALLLAIAVGIFALARIVASHTQDLRMMFTLEDGRLMYVPPIVASKIEAAGIIAGERFQLCKAAVKTGQKRSVEWSLRANTF